MLVELWTTDAGVLASCPNIYLVSRAPVNYCGCLEPPEGSPEKLDLVLLQTQAAIKKRVEEAVLSKPLVHSWP